MIFWGKRLFLETLNACRHSDHNSTKKHSLHKRWHGSSIDRLLYHINHIGTCHYHPMRFWGLFFEESLVDSSRADISFPQNLVGKNCVRPFRFVKIIAIALCLCFEKYCVLHELCRRKKQPVSKPAKTFHKISVYWLCKHKRQTYISAVYERITKGQFKKCNDLDNIPLFGRNASKFCYLKVIKSKKTVKQMYFIKKKYFHIL